jgi:SAM-dependent methyltransferase
VASTNYEKFQTTNPVVRRLIDSFYARIEQLVTAAAPASVLDAGCGEGETLMRLAGTLPERVAGIDISEDAVAIATERLPALDLRQGDVYELPFGDGEFELVLCLEVLEHLDHPERALDELARVAAREVVISVPHEPWFRLGSLMRGKYLSGFGNHPEHVNHWNGPKLTRLLEGQFGRVAVDGSFPWLIASFEATGGPVPSPKVRAT